MAGLSLIELMVAIVLGLLVILAAIGLFTGNRAVYDSTEALSRIQENARAGFELMARDIRIADGTVCRAPVDLTTAAAAAEKMPLIRWPPGEYSWGTLGQWGDGVRGWAGDNGDVIELRSAISDAAPIVEHKGNTLTYSGRTRLTGDGARGLLVCDSNTGYLLALGGVGLGKNSISYKAAPCMVLPEGGLSPEGGGMEGLGEEAQKECDANRPLIDPARRSAFIAPVTAVRWQVDKNPRGGRSLYRVTPGSVAGEEDDKAEVIDGIRSLTLSYLLPGKTAYVTAQQVGDDWKEVRAVRVALELDASPGGGADRDMRRRIVHVVNLRNRSP